MHRVMGSLNSAFQTTIYFVINDYGFKFSAEMEVFRLRYIRASYKLNQTCMQGDEQEILRI